MASTNPRINQADQDLVAILDGESFEQLFASAHVMRVSVREMSKLTSYPVEDGTLRTDHRILDPVEIEIPLLLTDETRDLFEKLRQAFIEGADLIVQTKVRSYPTMMIYEMPHEEVPDQGDAIPMAIKLREIRVITPEFGTLPPRTVANKAQASTVKSGNKQTPDAGEGSPAAASGKRASSLLGELKILEGIG